MIDIHSHILPGLDDGAKDLADSLEMARIAVSEGIRTIFATPHHANGKYTNDASKVMSAVEQLNDILRERKLPLKVLHGQEIRVYPGLIDDWHNRELLTLNRSRYILLELPTGSIPSSFGELLHELSVLKLVPIIAHPERNAEIAGDPDLLTQFIERGALSQITSHSVIGAFGKKVQRLCLELCRRNLVHFVASDAHHAVLRPYRLRECYEYLRSEAGDRYVEYYHANAASLVADEPVEVWEPQRKKKWFKLWK